MLHPLLVDYLLDKYADNNSVVLDPFSGSGVTLLQSGLKGYRSIGFDINPLALLISKSKNTNYDLNLLQNDIQNVKKDIDKNDLTDVPNIKNIDYWYSPSAQKSLGRIRYVLKNNLYNYSDLLITCFALVCRNQSYTRNGEFKRYRIEAEKLKDKKDESIKKFFENLDAAFEIIKKSGGFVESPLHFLDSVENIRKYDLKYDLIITSPPYGDSRTTVAYGQFSSFALEWVNDLLGNFEIKYDIDKQSIGRKRDIAEGLFDNYILMDVLSHINSIDGVRCIDVLNFFNEYYIILKNILSDLPIGGTVCYIVGNRRVKGVEIPTDQITAEMMTNCGITIQQILVRDISNKVMPLSNSPSNQAGKKDKTMSYEYIIIGKKDKHEISRRSEEAEKN